MLTADTVTIRLSADDAERVALSLHSHTMKLLKQENMQAADEFIRVSGIIRTARFCN